MGIDIQKSPAMLAAMMAVVYGVSTVTGCAGPSESQPNKQPIERVPAAATPTPQIAPLAGLLKPAPIERAQLFTYKQGVIVNLASAIDLGYIKPNLRMINTDPAFGLNFTDQDQNITYFFPQSFVHGNGRQEAIRVVEEQFPMVTAIFAAEQGIERGRMRFSIISLADALRNIVTSNTRGYPPEDSFWGSALSVELGDAYVGVTQLGVFDIQNTPATYPEISVDLKRSLAQRVAYPFAARIADPRYFAALGLTKPSFN